MSTTTMTPTPSDIALPLCKDTAFKQEMVQRISAHIEDEVRDYINTHDICLQGDAYEDELSAMLSYLDDNLLIYIK
jgi:hypothetical protein